MTTPPDSGYILTMGESLLALAVIIAMLLAVADTPLYPAAFGAVGLAALYVVLHSKSTFLVGNQGHTAFSDWAKWASSKLA